MELACNSVAIQIFGDQLNGHGLLPIGLWIRDDRVRIIHHCYLDN